MFKEGSLIRSNRTGSFVFVVGWPLAHRLSGRHSGKLMVVRHNDRTLIGNNYQDKHK